MTSTKKLLESMIVNQAPRCIWIRDHPRMIVNRIFDGWDTKRTLLKRIVARLHPRKSNTKGDV